MEMGGLDKMKGSTSMPNMNRCTLVITNPTKVVKVPWNGGEHANKSSMEEKKFNEETQHEWHS
jgi:aspartate-semialdehyde dehydrogenase